MFGKSAFIAIVAIGIVNAAFSVLTIVGGSLIKADIIAYVSDRSGFSREMYLMQVDRRLEFGPVTNLFNTGAMSWSVDGEQIALSISNESGMDIYVVRMSGGRLRRVSTINQADRPDHSVWSPDGNSLAYTYLNRTSPEPELWRDEIHIVDLSGALQRRFDSLNSTQRLDWSPDGKTILFDANPEGGNNNIYTLEVGTGEIRQITSAMNYEHSAVWSPDGKQIAYVSLDAVGFYYLYLMDGDGRRKRFIVNGFNPTWSPDGQRLAYASNGRDGVQIYVIELWNGEVTQLTSKGENYYPAWRP
jgi:Tol biopolymer transport system component